MAAVERKIINRSHFKPHTWKRYIDDVYSLWNINKEEINSFIEQANSYHPTTKFTAEISDKEVTFLDTEIIVAIWRGNMHGYLSADIICSEFL